MVRRGSLLALFLLLLCGLLASPPRARRSAPPEEPPLLPPAAGPRFEGDFEARLRAAPADRHVQALLDLTDQVDVARLSDRLRAAGRDKRARRQSVIGALEQVARRQQALLLPLIDRLLQERALLRVERVAIVNRLLVEGTASGVLALAARPEVAHVLPEWTSLPGAGGAVPNPDSALGEQFRSWAVDAVGASSLWAEGLDGRGVVVAALDTGVDGGHEQLQGRRLAGTRGWFDPEEGSSEPYDPHGHGTSVLSQAVGGGVPERIVGIAPGARWAAALANANNQYSRRRMTLAADWALRSARPDVLVNAWSHDEGACPPFDAPFLRAWRAAEIFVVFPAGNAGPEPRTGEAPAQLPGAFAVGGLTRSGEPLRASSRGPSACGDQLFPSLAAPAAELPFAFPAGERAYVAGDGTSLAAAVVAGGAALLLQAVPELGPAEMEDVLRAAARDVPPEGADTATGAGALDLVRALARARSVRQRDRAVGVQP
ncbi:MAG TPA: S8 family serine peptidase [Candidatus Polarisedimenticolaceae bacterium]|nr:S8 family serine peptidase [Candidatus Polarisedimenticolaceae bacterium]